jgi:hypothetical protein
MRLAAAWSWRFPVIVATLAVLYYGLGYLSEITTRATIALLLCAMLNPVKQLLVNHNRGPLAASTTLSLDDLWKGQPRQSRLSGRGYTSSWVAPPPGARTRAPPRSHSTSRARTSVSRNLWCPPGVTIDPSRAFGGPSVHCSRVHPEYRRDLPGGEQSISAVRGHLPRTPFPGREIPLPPRSRPAAALVKPQALPPEVIHRLCGRREFDPAQGIALPPTRHKPRRRRPPRRALGPPGSLNS